MNVLISARKISSALGVSEIGYSVRNCIGQKCKVFKITSHMTIWNNLEQVANLVLYVAVISEIPAGLKM